MDLSNSSWPFVVHDNTGMYVGSFQSRTSAESDIAMIEAQESVYNKHPFTTPFTITFDPKGLTS
jgi:uncharacterized NAD-dependent epimerase/dehydratase family protein